MRRARKGLSDYLGVPEDHILPVAGGIAAIDLALSVCSGKVFIIPPTFGEYAARAALYGRQVETWPGRCGENDSLVLCNPNNPTGEARSREELLSLLETVRSNGGNLVVDEAFIDYCPEYSLRENIGPGLILAGSLSKILGVPGIRIGYMLSLDTELLDKIRKHLPEWNVSRIAERTGEAAANVLESTDYLRASVRMIKQEREYLTGQLEKLGVRVYSSDTNYLLIKCGSDLYEKLLGRGILIRRCANFSGLDDTYFRIAVRQHEDNVELINVLGKVL